MNPFRILGMLGSNVQFRKILEANSKKPDQTPRSAVFGLVLHCLPMSHEKDSIHVLIQCKHFYRQIVYLDGLCMGEDESIIVVHWEPENTRGHFSSGKFCEHRFPLELLNLGSEFSYPH